MSFDVRLRQACGNWDDRPEVAKGRAILCSHRHYVKTGQCPDQTMLVMEIVKAGTNASINKQGVFEDQFVGIEVALKDEKRFPEKWGYYKFFESDGRILPDAKPFAKEACWECHNKHAAADNVLVRDSRSTGLPMASARVLDSRE